MILSAQIRTRIDRVIERTESTHDPSGDPDLVHRHDGSEPFEPDVIAETMAERITSLVKSLVERYYRRAVLERPILAESFPFGVSAIPNSTESSLLQAFARLHSLDNSLHGSAQMWPKDVAMIDVIRALERTGDKGARHVAQLLRTTNLSMTPEAFAPETLAPDTAGAIAVARWPPLGCAVILATERAVREEAKRALVQMPARKNARAAAAVLSQGSCGPWDKELSLDRRRRKVILRWNGSPRASRFDLDANGLVVRDRIDEDLVCAILDEMHADGLRDWIVLHRMAAQQGRTGKFVWSWREHREQTAYARRITSKNLTDEEANREVMARLWKLKGAELWELVDESRNGHQTWKRVGPFGLIDIPLIGTKKPGDSLELAGILINPELYEGAAKGEEPYFALLPNEVLDLDGPCLRLATLLAFEMRYARDHDGILTRTAGVLWEYATVRGGQPEPKEWARAAVVLHRALDEMVQAGALGAWTQVDHGEVTQATRYELRPARWWRDQVILDVPPEMGPPRATRPTNGAELKAWREKRGWSQEEAAAKLSVGRSTLQRAETAANEKKPLGRALVKALAQFSPEAPPPESPPPASKR